VSTTAGLDELVAAINHAFDVGFDAASDTLRFGVARLCSVPISPPIVAVLHVHAHGGVFVGQATVVSDKHCH
jgi:hypothetical protein